MTLLAVGFELTRVEFTGKILFTFVRESVESSRRLFEQSQISEFPTSVTDVVVRSIDFICDHLRSPSAFLMKKFQNLVISPRHPTGSFSHRYISLKHCLMKLPRGNDSSAKPDSLVLVNNSELLASTDLCVISIEYQITRVTRGPDCHSGPLGKCGPVFRAPGPRGSRKQGTQAMCENESGGIETPDRTAASYAITKPTSDPINGVDVRTTPVVGEPRKLSFEPTQDGDWLEIHYQWNGCQWREAGYDRLDELTIEAAPAGVPDILAKPVLEALFRHASEADHGTLSEIATAAFGEEIVSEAFDSATCTRRAQTLADRLETGGGE